MNKCSKQKISNKILLNIGEFSLNYKIKIEINF